MPPPRDSASQRDSSPSPDSAPRSGSAKGWPPLVTQLRAKRAPPPSSRAPSPAAAPASPPTARRTRRTSAGRCATTFSDSASSQDERNVLSKAPQSDNLGASNDPW